MKVAMFRMVQAAMPVLGSLALGAALTACGSDSSNPEAVDVKELKFPSGLRIVDQGNGTARLIWSGSNNEDGFSGYNIYGVKDTTGNFVAKDGQTLKLLNEKGEPSGDAALLQQMSYNGTDWETVGTDPNPDADIAYYAYYKNKNAEAKPLMPSCLPAATADASGMYKCEETAAADKTGYLNGETYLDLTGLKVGSTYCFTAVSTLTNGTKVSQTTSEMRCIVPKSKVTVAATAFLDASKHFKIDLNTVRKACGETGGTACGAIKIDDIQTGSCDATTAASFCIETFSNTLNFTAGKNSAVQDLGYYAHGFDDATLPLVPKLTNFSALQNKDGFSLAGQSLPIETGHVYAIAQGTTDNDNPTSFYYDLIYVTIDATGQMSFEARLSNKVDAQ